MDLEDYRQRLIDVYGNTLSDETTFYNRIINDAYRELCAYADWYWLETEEILRFEAVPTARSFSVSPAHNVVELTTGDTLATAYRYGWFYTGENTFRVADISDPAASPQTLTLASNYIEATGTSTLEVWNDMKELSATAFAIDHVLSLRPMHDPNTPPLRHVDIDEIEAMGPDLTGYADDIADRFAVIRQSDALDSIGTKWWIRVFPPPDTEAEYVLRYIAEPAELANDTAQALIPAKHESVLVNFARLHLAKVGGEPADVVALWESEAQKGLARMLTDLHKKNKHTQMGRRGWKITHRMPYKLTNTEGVTY